MDLGGHDNWDFTPVDLQKPPTQDYSSLLPTFRAPAPLIPMSFEVTVQLPRRYPGTLLPGRLLQFRSQGVQCLTIAGLITVVSVLIRMSLSSNDTDPLSSGFSYPEIRAKPFYSCQTGAEYGSQL